jgi:nitroimidazol reductase NimA-like FMN-containing flavoprotein (pyridoxamine 5'-phosphate oxidase superfamily)
MMNYINDNVRRQDRLLDEKNATDLLHSGEFGFLSMVETDAKGSGAYGIPISYVWDGGKVIYFHCAPEGHKLNCLRDNSRVSFCVVGQTNVIPHEFTIAYESILVRGTVVLDISAEERMRALELILDKYSPNDKVTGLKYAEKSFHLTAIIRLDISAVSGKTKRVIS